jgi:GT2 family glycosyltransferase
MRLSVIIIGYNSWHFLERNLASLAFLCHDSQAEIIYVDNASRDGTLSKIKQFYPGILCIENAKNAGISVARNRGILKSSGDYIWLLDSDTEISAASLNVMLAFMDENPGVGLCGCKMYGQDGSVQESCRRFPTVGGKLGAAIRILAKRWNESLFSAFHQPDGYAMDAEHPFEVDYVIGACQLIRRKAQEQTGLLDERIFYGPEDADFCLRMKQVGYQVFYLPQVSIFHAYQRTSSHKIFSRITWEHLKGLVYYFRKHW